MHIILSSSQNSPMKQPRQTVPSHFKDGQISVHRNSQAIIAEDKFLARGLWRFFNDSWFVHFESSDVFNQWFTKCICNLWVDSPLLIPLFLKEMSKQKKLSLGPGHHFSVNRWGFSLARYQDSQYRSLGCGQWDALALDVSGEVTLNSTFSRKRKAKTWGLCGRMYIVRRWKKGMNSMKNKNPISVKAKSVNKAKVEERLKRKSIGSEIKNGWAIVPAYQRYKR